MQGKVMVFDPDIGAGVIKGENGRPYYFKMGNFEGNPESGLPVEFEPNKWRADKIRRQIAEISRGN